MTPLQMLTLVTDDKKQIKQESRNGHISFEVYIYLQGYHCMKGCIKLCSRQL